MVILSWSFDDERTEPADIHDEHIVANIDYMNGLLFEGVPRD